MATLAQVAAHAQVGIGTVSRVLNGRPNVSDEMRTRVLAAAAAVGYEPARRRRSTAANRQVGGHGAGPGYVGVLVTYFDEASAYQRLRGIVGRLQPHGYEVVLYNVAAPAQARQRLLEIPDFSILDGLIVISLPLTADDGAHLAAASYPTVLLDTTAPGLPSVNIDDRAGGAMATQHLIDLGHRRIGLVGGHGDPFGFVASVHREEGYRQALGAAGIAVEPDLVRHGAHLRSAAKQMTLDLLAIDDPPTAIVATSDLQAVGVLDAAAALGRRVPDDMAVVGYDDIELAGLMGITTVRQPLERSGQRAAELVLEAMTSGRRSALAEELELELVVRSTTGPRR